MASGPDVHLVGRDDPRRATFLELFFDLIYVFVFAELVSRLVRRLRLTQVMTWPDGLLNEAGKLLLLLVAVWFVWWHTAWTTSRYDPKRPQIQLVVIIAVFGSVVMGLALPRAFRLYGLIFVIAYVGTHLARSLILALSVRGERRRLKLRMLIYYGCAAVPWFVGTELDQWRRGLVWLSALLIEFFGTKFGWPVPGFKRTSEEASVIAGEHLGERYQQIFLIALGESILGSGLALSQIGSDGRLRRIGDHHRPALADLFPAGGAHPGGGHRPGAPSAQAGAVRRRHPLRDDRWGGRHLDRLSARPGPPVQPVRGLDHHRPRTRAVPRWPDPLRV
jgi:low temperature requirement protein LtrA